jgi:uncharacterized membrane protein SpoIIM required for sporulation
MRQEQFVEKHSPSWLAFEAWLDARADRPRQARNDRTWKGLPDEDMPHAYRRVCQQLGLARRRGYSPAVVDRLQQLMQRGHNALYRPPAPRWSRIPRFFLAEFPRRVRADAGYMALALACFALPLVATFAWVRLMPEYAASMFSPAQLQEFEAMYASDVAGGKLGRDGGTDVAMFGFYILNNISIGLRTFASGLVGGIGSAAALIYNGLFFGVFAAHLVNVGLADPLWRFVCGHASFELTAIVIAGGAGLRLGLGLVAPGRRRRIDALVEGGRRGAMLALGVAGMLLIAAFIEAFWSSIGAVPASIKYSVAGVLWALVLAWLAFGGRGLRDAD